jgi:hypothetical protein
MDAATLVLQPKLLPILLQDPLHEISLQHNLLLPCLRRRQAKFNLVLYEELLQLVPLQLIPDIGLLQRQPFVLEIDTGNGLEVTLL